ncbi:MAG: MmcQ/YjbR family DNA-binding protein [Oscillospiraceae bacterium]|nr:MmcQ/YjbR family DNA-binding protein [Oscillospiraceae bacterium]
MLKKIFEYAENTYQSEPEYLWKRLPEAAVFRNKSNQKWYALCMKIGRDKLGLKEKASVWILNLKCDPLFIGSLLEMDGYYPAYHMNKNHWITILLDGTVEEKQILELLDFSYHLTEKRKKHESA